MTKTKLKDPPQRKAMKTVELDMAEEDLTLKYLFTDRANRRVFKASDSNAKTIFILRVAEGKAAAVVSQWGLDT